MQNCQLLFPKYIKFMETTFTSFNVKHFIMVVSVVAGTNFLIICLILKTFFALNFYLKTRTNVWKKLTLSLCIHLSQYVLQYTYKQRLFIVGARARNYVSRFIGPNVFISSILSFTLPPFHSVCFHLLVSLLTLSLSLSKSPYLVIFIRF